VKLPVAFSGGIHAELCAGGWCEACDPAAEAPGRQNIGSDLDLLSDRQFQAHANPNREAFCS
jgi:hypothetical protein